PNRVQLIAVRPTTRPAAEAGVGVLAVADWRQRLPIDEGEQSWRSLVAEALLPGFPEQADGDAIDPPAQRGGGGKFQRPPGSRTPVAALTGPGDRAIVQGSPEQDRNQYPGLLVNVLWAEVLGGLPHHAVQQRPAFAFHDAPPS